MDMFQINGGIPLIGRVPISGSKNASLPLLTAALLTDDITVLDNIPDLADIRGMAELLRHLGAKVEFHQSTLRIDPSGMNKDTVPYQIMCKMRASFYAMGPLLARKGRARVSQPGGCAIGDRPIDIHLRGFKALGARISDRVGGYIHAVAKDGLVGGRFSLMGEFGTSVGATVNVLMAAVLAKGETVIEDAAREPEITELASFLIAMGAKISGHGTNTITVQGVEKLHGIRWSVCMDRIEAATYAIAGLVTHGDVRLENVERTAMMSTLAVFAQWGAIMDWESESVLRIRRGHPTGRALNVTTEPFPGFPTDVQSPLTVLMALTPGTSILKDTIYPDRFKQVPELKRLGAQIRTIDKGTIEVDGVETFDGAAVMASDLRAGAALVVAALAAEGTSQVRRIYHVERGYEKIEEKLRGLGADIRRLKETVEDPGLIQDVVWFPENQLAPATINDENVANETTGTKSGVV